MSTNWSIYNKRLNINGSTERERQRNRLESAITNHIGHSLSYKDVVLNGKKTQLIINTGTKPYYKEFESLPGQKILAGDYVEWKNQTWLIFDADCDDEIYTDGNLRQCQHKIYWQNVDGKIISRYVWTQNASAYNNGETGNNTITLQSNQFMAYMPYDDDTCLLNNGVRIHMSKKNNICKPYTLTRPDDITYGYGEKGIINIIFTQTQYNQASDKLVTLEDGSKVWICDYHSPTIQPEPLEPNEITDLCATINGNTNLKCGYARSYSVVFTDLEGNSLTDVDFEWNVVSNFNVEQTITGNMIKLMVNDDDYINSSFLLSVNINQIIITQIKITVIDNI